MLSSSLCLRPQLNELAQLPFPSFPPGDDRLYSFPEDPAHPAYRMGAYTFGAVRDLVHSEYWQVGLGGDVTFYSKPAVLDPIYGNNPVSFHVFVRIRAGLMEHGHCTSEAVRETNWT